MEENKENKQEEWNDINLNKIVDVDYEESDKSVGIFQGCFCIVGIDDKGKQQQIFLSDDVMVNLFDKLQKYFKGYLEQQEQNKEMIKEHEEHEGIA